MRFHVSHAPDQIEQGSTELWYLAADYDNLFKSIVSSGWANQSDGNVEAPVGFFTLIEVPGGHPSTLSERWTMKEAVCSADGDERKLFDELEPGWYFTTEDSNGIILVSYSPHEYVARQCYAECVESFAKWNEEV